MGYELLKAQREFLHVDPDVNLDICVYQGGFGSGKTFIGTYLGIRLARKYPESRGLAVARTWPLLRDTTLVAYFRHFDAIGWEEGKHWIWKASEKKMIFPEWGSEILFRHLQEPWKLKSLNLAWIHVEEMSEITEAAFLLLLSRLRQSGIDRYRLFGTTNPQANKSWIWKHFVLPPKDPRAPGTEYRRVFAPSTENTHLPESNLENMKAAYDEDYYRINVLGEDCDYTSGLVVKKWSDLNEIETTFKPNLTINISCDFNVDPMCWVLCHRFNGEYHFFDEIVVDNTTTVESVDVFASRYPPDVVTEIIINGDASGNSRSTQAGKANDSNYTIMLSRLSELGYKKIRVDVRDCNPPVMSRIQAFNAMVCNQNGVRRVFMNPKTCPRTLYNNHNLMYVEGTSEIEKPTPRAIKLDKSLKYMVHPFDAESYIIERYDPVMLKLQHSKAQEPPELYFDV